MGNDPRCSQTLVTRRESLRVGRPAANRVEDLSMGWESRCCLLVRRIQVPHDMTPLDDDPFREQLCRNTVAATHAAGWIESRGCTIATTGAASYRREARVC